MIVHYRLLKETGRFSNSPVFVVGIYSGNEQLGEGFGSSLNMAEYRVRVSHCFHPLQSTAVTKGCGRRSAPGLFDSNTTTPHTTTDVYISPGTGRRVSEGTRRRVCCTGADNGRDHVRELWEEWSEADSRYDRKCNIHKLNFILLMVHLLDSTLEACDFFGEFSAGVSARLCLSTGVKIKHFAESQISDLSIYHGSSWPLPPRWRRNSRLCCPPMVLGRFSNPVMDAFAPSSPLLCSLGLHFMASGWPVDLSTSPHFLFPPMSKNPAAPR